MKVNYEGASLPNRGGYILFSECLWANVKYEIVTKCLRANVKYENGVGEMGEKDFKDNQWGDNCITERDISLDSSSSYGTHKNEWTWA